MDNVNKSYELSTKPATYVGMEYPDIFFWYKLKQFLCLNIGHVITWTEAILEFKFDELDNVKNASLYVEVVDR